MSWPAGTGPGLYKQIVVLGLFLLKCHFTHPEGAHPESCPQTQKQVASKFSTEHPLNQVLKSLILSVLLGAGNL